MNRRFATSLLAIAAYGFSTQALGECSQLVKEFIQNSGGNKEAAIAHTRKLVANAKNDKSGSFWKLPKNQRQEVFAALDENAKETINSIQSCTESDLASIAPNTKTSQSGSTASTPTQRCGSRIDTGTWNWGSWRVVSESPLSVLQDGYTIPSPESYWETELFRNINYTINNNAEESERRGAQKMKDWLLCLSGRGGVVPASAGAASTQAEQIPNCPPTLPPSCVTWSQYDQQLQWWNLTNNCGRDVSVTFRSEGALENTQTFGNGESYRAKWRGSNPPKQIVWDAAKGVGFYRNKPAGSALKCQSSLPL